jgi:polar amino acid transport system substrate-binding protein
MTRWLAAALVLTLAGCASTSGDAQRAALGALAVPSVTPTPSPTPKPCTRSTPSLRPAQGPIAPGSFTDRIRRRGRLIAGVDQNSLRLAYLRPSTGRIEGFEVDLLREIARALGTRLDLRAVTTAQRESMVRSGQVDLVMDAMSITCQRLRLVAFSTAYLDAGLRLLVPASSPARSLADLGGRRVCATKASTTLKRIAKDASHPIPYPVSQRTDCLVLLQQGTVDAIASDDTILLGFHDQDPKTKLIGPRLEDEFYGIAINKRHPDLVRYVNGVLERLRRDGTWQRLYRRWLSDLAASSSPPPARYRD